MKPNGLLGRGVLNSPQIGALMRSPAYAHIAFLRLDSASRVASLLEKLHA